MKIKSIKKYEDESRIVNVNFVTSMIENSQVSIGMKYFVVEFYNKQKMGYDVGIALDEEALVKELSDCTYGMSEHKFVRLISDIVKETPKFCYVYDNPWKYVLERKYRFCETVKLVESAISKDINAYHNCKLYDLLEKDDKRLFECVHPNKLVNSKYDDKMSVSDDYKVLYSILWDWFNTLTKGKYELVDDVLYSKTKKAEEKLSILKYTELSDDDSAEVCKFVKSQLKENGWYHNTGDMRFTTADGRKLVITGVDTLDLAVGLDFEVNMIGDYIVETFTRSMGKLFKGADGFNLVHSVNIDGWFREALKMEGYNENRFYEYNSPYGRFGYDVWGISNDIRWQKVIGRTIFVTKVNEKSIQFITSDEHTIYHINDDEVEKRQLETEWKDGVCYESFKFYKGDIRPKFRTKFTPEALMEDARNRAKEYYEEAVEKFGEPIDEQKASEDELIAAATEAL